MCIETGAINTEYGAIRHQAVIGSETSLPGSKPPSLTCSTSTTRLGWTCGSTSVNCEPPQSVNGICGWKQAVVGCC